MFVETTSATKTTDKQVSARLFGTPRVQPTKKKDRLNRPTFQYHIDGDTKRTSLSTSSLCFSQYAPMSMTGGNHRMFLSFISPV
jgi:hypothetical protein